MKLNIAMIKGIRGGSLPFEFIMERDELKFSDEEALNLTAPLVVRGTVTNNGKNLLVQGLLKTIVQLKCGCCLEPFLLALEEEFCEEFIEGEPAAGDAEFDETEPSYFQGDIISLRELVRDLLSLALPMRPVCQENCKGLCVKCGKNLNHAVCDCYREDTDPRLSVLRHLLDKE